MANTAKASADAPAYNEDQNAPLSMDLAGRLRVAASVVATAESTAEATAAAPSYTEGQDAPLSQDRSGNLRVIPSNAATAATAAKQDTGNSSLELIQLATSKVIPATTAEAVTPSDATALTSRSVWVGGAGDLSVRLSGATGTTVVFTAVPAGTLLPISVVRIMAATTATNINVLN